MVAIGTRIAFAADEAVVGGETPDAEPLEHRVNGRRVAERGTRPALPPEPRHLHVFRRDQCFIFRALVHIHGSAGAVRAEVDCNGTVVAAMTGGGGDRDVLPPGWRDVVDRRHDLPLQRDHQAVIRFDHDPLQRRRSGVGAGRAEGEGVVAAVAGAEPQRQRRGEQQRRQQREQDEQPAEHVAVGVSVPRPGRLRDGVADDVTMTPEPVLTSWARAGRPCHVRPLKRCGACRGAWCCGAGRV